MTSIGLIVNPSASRDVRRLTSLARTVDVHERANAVARVLCGLAGGGADSVWYMPEAAHVVERASDMLAATPGFGPRPAPPLRAVPLDGDGYAADAAGTRAAAAAMAREGVACIVTIGGDGTNRAVAAGWPDAVLMPLPGGTNNAFAAPIDPTAAGLAAAFYALEPARFGRHVNRRPLLECWCDDPQPAIALVDIAVVRGGWVGAHAIWDPALLVEAVLTHGDPSLTGLAGVAGAAGVGGLTNGRADGAVRLRFGRPGRRVLAPLGPGQLVPVEVASVEAVDPGAWLTVPGRPADGQLTVAFDGEREIVLEPGSVARVRLVPGGPRVLDAAALLRAAAADGRLDLPADSGAPP